MPGRMMTPKKLFSKGPLVGNAAKLAGAKDLQV
jgi:hypothetical protein